MVGKRKLTSAGKRASTRPAPLMGDYMKRIARLESKVAQLQAQLKAQTKELGIQRSRATRWERSAARLRRFINTGRWL